MDMKVNIEFDVFATEDGQVMLATNDARFHSGDGGDGLKIVANVNPDSANYNPNLYNRLVNFLIDHGLPHPPRADSKRLPGRRLRQRTPRPTIVVNGEKWGPEKKSA